jgi:parvulin-like peptidyl-prolyl isomerase
MAQVLQIEHQTIPTTKVLTLLANYQMLPQFLREVITDRAIAPLTCTPEETAIACQDFFQKNNIPSEMAQEEWRSLYEMTLEDLEQLATRAQRIERFKHDSWNPRIPSYFLQRKTWLDQVVYSMIRVKDLGVAHELYFRIQEGEQSFAELAQAYGQSPEAEAGGVVGPVELGQMDRSLAQRLYASQPGQLLPMLAVGEWSAIVRLENLIPVQLDEAIRQKLLNELFETWLQEELVQLLSEGLVSLQ